MIDLTINTNGNAMEGDINMEIILFSDIAYCSGSGEGGLGSRFYSSYFNVSHTNCKQVKENNND